MFFPLVEPLGCIIVVNLILEIIYQLSKVALRFCPPDCNVLEGCSCSYIYDLPSRVFLALAIWLIDT